MTEHETHRPDGAVRVPGSVVTAVVIALIIGIPGTLVGAAMWVTHKQDSDAALVEHVGRVEQAVTALGMEVSRRDGETNAHVQQMDAFERALSDRMARMESSILLMAQTHRLFQQPEEPGR